MNYTTELSQLLSIFNEKIIAVFAFFISLGILFSLKKAILLSFNSLTKNNKITDGDLVLKIVNNLKSIFYISISISISLQLVTIKSNILKYINLFTLAVILYSIATSVQIMIDYLVDKYLDKKRSNANPEYDSSPIEVITKIAKGLVWVTVSLLFLQNAGLNVSALVAGVGISGIAVAFALQSLLEDIFSYFSIYFDKPFEVGDFLDVGQDQLGTVSRIGIKSTRLKTLQGEELIISNKDLTTARIHNYKKMEERRISFKFGILYETPLPKLKKVSSMVKDIIEAEEETRFDRAHFKSFGDSSLDFDVIYYFGISDYNAYMDVQERINLKLIEKFKKEKIEFAYPTRQVYVKNISSSN